MRYINVIHYHYDYGINPKKHNKSKKNPKRPNNLLLTIATFAFLSHEPPAMV
jgi:hypothetical protein